MGEKTFKREPIRLSAIFKGLSFNDIMARSTCVRGPMQYEKTRGAQVSMAEPTVSEETIDAVAAVLRSGRWAEGEHVAALEKEWAEYCRVKYCRAVSNGTAALVAVLQGLGVGPGDEVIVPAFTFMATPNAVVDVGATPVFADVDAEMFNINPQCVGRLITPRTKAIIVVHLFGNPVNMSQLYNHVGACIPVIEDACQAHGATHQGRRVGSFGEAAVFSLYPTKNMICGGEGGLITTTNAHLNADLREYTNHGQRERYVHHRHGINARMSEVSACIARASLKELNVNNTRRQRNAWIYHQYLHNPSINLRTPVSLGGDTHVYHQFTITVDDRDGLSRHLHERGIGHGTFYTTPCHQQGSMEYPVSEAGECPVAEALAGEVLSLPVHQGLTDEDIHHVIKVVNVYRPRPGST